MAVLQRCSAQLLITGDSLQYADQREEIWDICETVDSVATGYTHRYFDRPQPSRNHEYYDLITVRFFSP